MKNRILEIKELAECLVSGIVSDLARGKLLDDSVKRITVALHECYNQGVTDADKLSKGSETIN